jgi:ABC-2 type transport system ATP-binding protein
VGLCVDGVSKRFRIYHDRSRSLKETLTRMKRSSFEEFWALSDVSLEAEPGSTLGLIGENGSGKSTLLKCIAGILTPDKGTIEVDGRLSSLLELGAGFHPDLTGRENVYLNGAILGMSRKDVARAEDRIIEFAELEKFIDTPVRNYSSGMIVRLGFSIAVALDPDVLLIDEVLAVGDAAFQAKCRKHMEELRQSDKTLVIVSHDLASIRRLCDRAIWLADGKARAEGPVNGVVDAYLDFVAGVVGGAEADDGRPRLLSIEVLDAEGRPAAAVTTGGSLRIRLRYSAPTATSVAFGLTLTSSLGAVVAAPHSIGQAEVAEIEGEGWVECLLEDLPLQPDRFVVTAALHGPKGSPVYDRCAEVGRFEVGDGVPRAGAGMVRLDGLWHRVAPGDG